MPTFNPARFINTNPVKIEQEVYTPQNTFETFGLKETLVKTIHGLGLTAPTPIQDQIIPEITEGHDVVGLAETGTGKTAAFLIPLIEKTLSDKFHQTLILAPTRELAIQIQNELYRLSPRGSRISSTICVGGTSIRPQIKQVQRKNNFIIGTPGRMLDLIKRDALKTGGVGTVVLDEADRMLDMGFIRDVKSILGTLTKDRQTLFFSATMSQETERVVKEFLKNPVTISVKKKDTTDSIEQNVVPCDSHEKFDTLVKLLQDSSLARVMIFGAMKHSVEKLSKELNAQGIRSTSIHGNKSHNARQHALKAFKGGSTRVLVATDVAARGIHVDGVTHVINYDLPCTFDDYVHRIGRTGRANAFGKALTFIPR